MAAKKGQSQSSQSKKRERKEAASGSTQVKGKRDDASRSSSLIGVPALVSMAVASAALCLFVFLPHIVYAIKYAPSPGTCGDGVCHFLESAHSCPSDCADDVCGDGFCSFTEVCAGAGAKAKGRKVCVQDCGRCLQADNATSLAAPIDKEVPYLEKKRWGTYRARHYFGIKDRSPSPLSFGVGWGHNEEQLRFTCGDGVTKYGWQKHNGYDFGLHTAKDDDNGLHLHKYFVGVSENEWVARIEQKRRKKAHTSKWTSLYFYFSMEGGNYFDLDDVKVLLHPPHGGSMKNVSIGHEGVEVAEFSGYRILPESDFNKGAKGGENTRHIPFKAVLRLQKSADDLSVTPLIQRKPTYFSTYVHDPDHFYNVRGLVRDVTSRSRSQGHAVGTLGNVKKPEPGRSNMVILEVRVSTGGFQMDLQFADGDILPSWQPLSPSKIGELITKREGEFDQKLRDRLLHRHQHHTSENVSGEEGRKGSDRAIMEKTASFALSNHLGSMVYTHGSITYEPDSESPVFKAEPGRRGQPHLKETDTLPLFSGVPSRSFFPRGFLWDEGFHLLLTCRWDTSLCVDSLSHWMRWVTPSGWIPREMFLGKESRLGVEQKWWTQYEAHANPPSIVLPIDYLLTRLEATVNKRQDESSSSSDKGTSGKGEGERKGRGNGWSETSTMHQSLSADDERVVREFLSWSFPRLLRWFNYLRRTQSSPHKFTFKWRGRSFNDGLWHTLASGLDDYPRGTDPSRFDDELHVDLTSWIYLFSNVLKRVAQVVDASSSLPSLSSPPSHSAVELEKALKRVEKAVGSSPSVPSVSSSPSDFKVELEKALLENGYGSVEEFERHCSDLGSSIVEYTRAIFFNTGMRTFVDVGVVGDVLEVMRKERVQARRNTPRQDGREVVPPLPASSQWGSWMRLVGWRKADVTQLPHIGYVSLFPFLMNALPPVDPAHTHTQSGEGGSYRREVVEGTLDLLEEGGHLHSPFGVRSLSSSDPFYYAHEQYWRGPIWMNINYLTLKALEREVHDTAGREEGSQDSALHSRLVHAYTDLRSSLVKTVTRQFEYKESLFEQYSDVTGGGRRISPFTGWTSLIALIIGEDL